MTTKERVQAIWAKLPTMNCKGLCEECCGPIGMSDAEMKVIVERIGHQPAPMTRLGNQHLTTCLTCTMLKDGKCSIYDIRPIICRLWGMVRAMPCPHGCKPSRWVSDNEASALMSELEKLSVN